MRGIRIKVLALVLILMAALSFGVQTTESGVSVKKSSVKAEKKSTGTKKKSSKKAVSKKKSSKTTKKLKAVKKTTAGAVEHTDEANGAEKTTGGAIEKWEKPENKTWEKAKKKKYAKETEHALSGYTTWYRGYRTASGELLDSKGFTAAHRTLPFGTIVKVTNTKTDKTIFVRVNDRGPWRRKFYIDLSYAAFKVIKGNDRDLVRTVAEVVTGDEAKEAWKAQYVKKEEEKSEEGEKTTDGIDNGDKSLEEKTEAGAVSDKVDSQESSPAVKEETPAKAEITISEAETKPSTEN